MWGAKEMQRRRFSKACGWGEHNYVFNEGDKRTRNTEGWGVRVIPGIERKCRMGTGGRGVWKKC